MQDTALFAVFLNSSSNTTLEISHAQKLMGIAVFHVWYVLGNCRTKSINYLEAMYI